MPAEGAPILGTPDYLAPELLLGTPHGKEKKFRWHKTIILLSFFNVAHCIWYCGIHSGFLRLVFVTGCFFPL